MIHRQTGIPSEWIVVNMQLRLNMWNAVRSLPREAGILVLRQELARLERRKLLVGLNRIARARRLTVMVETQRSAVRVHDVRELRRALLARTPLILLSPIFPTQSHPEWSALPRMRAASLARLAKRRVIALGGMTRRRFKKVQKLGFIGWAGISGWI